MKTIDFLLRNLHVHHRVLDVEHGNLAERLRYNAVIVRQGAVTEVVAFLFLAAGDAVRDTVDQNDECKRDRGKARCEGSEPGRVRAPRNIVRQGVDGSGGGTGELLAVAKGANSGGAFGILEGVGHLAKIEERDEGSGEGEEGQEKQEETVHLLGKGKGPDLESTEEESEEDDQQQGDGQDAENQKDVDHIEDLADGAVDGVLFPVAHDGGAGLESLGVVLEGTGDSLDIVGVNGDVQEGGSLLESSGGVRCLGGVCGEKVRMRRFEGNNARSSIACAAATYTSWR